MIVHDMRNHMLGDGSWKMVVWGVSVFTAIGTSIGIRAVGING